MVDHTGDSQNLTHTKRNHGDDRGFTLMELVVAVFIVGIMIAGITPHLLGAGARAQTVACQENGDAIKSALTEYDLLNQNLPTGTVTEQIQALVDAQLLASVPTEPKNAVYTISDADPNNIVVTCQLPGATTNATTP